MPEPERRSVTQKESGVDPLTPEGFVDSKVVEMPESMQLTNRVDAVD